MTLQAIETTCGAIAGELCVGLGRVQTIDDAQRTLLGAFGRYATAHAQATFDQLLTAPQPERHTNKVEFELSCGKTCDQLISQCLGIVAIVGVGDMPFLEKAIETINFFFHDHFRRLLLEVLPRGSA